MKHIKFIHQLTQFCINELQLRKEEYEILTQEEDYSYHSVGYVSGQINILSRIVRLLTNYDIE